MKQLTIILLGLFGVAYGQSAPTSAKTRFVNGIYLGTKLDSYFAAADSNAIYWRADSVVMAKYKGTARALAFAVSGGYIPYSDTTSLLSQVVRTFGTQTIGGNKTFSNDIVVNGLTVGRGGGGVSSNTAIGTSALNANTSGTFNVANGTSALTSNTTGATNTALGYASMFNNTSGNNNTGVGRSSLVNLTSGGSNTGVGQGSGSVITTGSNNSYFGSGANASGDTVTNETVIGYNTTGNGSNTVTIGNSSVTGNYFSGNIRSSNGTAFLKNIASGSSSDSVLVSNNGEVRRVLQSSIGSGAYLPLSGGTLTGALSGTSLSMSGAGSFGGVLDVLSNSGTYSTFRTNDATSGNNAGGGFYNIASATQSTRNAAIWLDADGGNFSGSDYAVIAKTGGGKLDIDNYATSQPITFSFAGTEKARLANDGTFLINTTTTDGTNKLIVNGGVKVSGTTGLEVNGTDRVANFKGVGSGANSLLRYSDGTTAKYSTGFNGGNYIIYDDANTAYILQASNTLSAFTGSVSSTANSIVTTLGYNTSVGVASLNPTLNGTSLINNTFVTGKAASLNNAATIIYAHASDGSTNNQIGFGFWSNDNLFTLKATGAATFSSSVTAGSLIKSGGTSTQALIADGSVQTLTSGTYTPTLTNTTNITSSTASLSSYTRIGNIVTVYAVASATTSAAGQAELTFSVPIATSAANAVVVGSGIDSIRFPINNGSSGTTVGVRWTATSGTATNINVIFQYTVN